MSNISKMKDLDLLGKVYREDTMLWPIYCLVFPLEHRSLG